MKYHRPRLQQQRDSFRRGINSTVAAVDPMEMVDRGSNGTSSAAASMCGRPYGINTTTTIISPLSMAPTKNVGRGLAQQTQPWLLNSIDYHGIQAANTAVALTLHEVTSTTAARKHR